MKPEFRVVKMHYRYHLLQASPNNLGGTKLGRYRGSEDTINEGDEESLF